MRRVIHRFVSAIIIMLFWAACASTPDPVPAYEPTEPSLIVYDSSGNSIDIQEDSNLIPPQLIERVNPRYPDIARRTRVQGTVVMTAWINEQGNVVDTDIVRSLNTLCDQSAMEAVRQWKFKPAMLDGQAVPVKMHVTITFSLKN
jgi:periplasmic protein TonB